jgi:glutaconate CoA-transferase subunit A
MARIVSLKEAIAEYVRDGDTVALEGFTHLIPFAAGHEIIRQGKRDLTLARMTPDLIYDQMIGMGCAKKLIFSWAGNPGVGSLHRFRDAVESGWPLTLDLDERTHSALANAYVAGAAGLPFALIKGHAGTDLPEHNNRIKPVVCPFTGETLSATPAIRPKTTIIHAQKADLNGNVMLWGITGVQKEAALAARHVVVTVEEIVDSLNAWPNATILPSWTTSAVCEVPGGAHPSYALGYYDRDNRFYRQWNPISRHRRSFREWMDRHVLQTRDFAQFRRRLANSR